MYNNFSGAFSGVLALTPPLFPVSVALCLNICARPVPPLQTCKRVVSSVVGGTVNHALATDSRRKTKRTCASSDCGTKAGNLGVRSRRASVEATCSRPRPCASSSQPLRNSSAQSTRSAGLSARPSGGPALPCLRIVWVLRVECPILLVFV